MNIPEILQLIEVKSFFAVPNFRSAHASYCFLFSTSFSSVTSSKTHTYASYGHFPALCLFLPTITARTICQLDNGNGGYYFAVKFGK